MFDWEQVIRKKAVVLSVLMRSVTVRWPVPWETPCCRPGECGRTYLQTRYECRIAGVGESKNVVNLHCDEFNELRAMNLFRSSTRAVVPVCR